MGVKRLAVLLLAGMLFLPACQRSKEKGPSDRRSAAAPSPTASAQPHRVPSAPPPTVVIRGKVLETMNAAGYTYMKLKTDKGEVWAAVPETKVEPGEELGVIYNMEMRNFTSRTLNRTFDRLLFCTRVVDRGVR